MTDKVKILAFAGSLRKDSLNKKALKVAIKGAEDAGAEVTYIDLNDFPMPIYNADDQEKKGFPKSVEKMQKMLLEHDGLLVASPEYNGSISGALKNFLDWTSRANGELKTAECFKSKIAGTIAATPGRFGGLRCLAHLRDIFAVLLVNTLPSEIGLAEAHKLFDKNDKMLNKEMRIKLEELGAAVTRNLQNNRKEVEVVDSAPNSASGCGQNSAKDGTAKNGKTPKSKAAKSS